MPQFTADMTLEHFLEAYRPGMFDPDDPRTIEMYEEAKLASSSRAALVIPACPSWCELDTGHEYAEDPWDRSPLTFARHHLRTIGTVVVEHVEEIRSGEGTFWPPYCDLGENIGDEGDGLLSANRVRVVAADFLRTGDLLDEITAVQA